MRIYDLIAKKRDGGTHSREELETIVNGFVRGEVADYQMTAWMIETTWRKSRRRKSRCSNKIYFAVEMLFIVHIFL